MDYETIPDGWQAMSGWDFWHDYHAGTWEPETHETIQQYVVPGSTYIDIGAWIGPTVKWAAETGAARVLAVEPDPVAWTCLFQNTNNLANVTRVNGAIADHTGEVMLLSHTSGYGSSMSRMQAPAVAGPWYEHGVNVQCWTLPDFWTEFDITDCSLVKMDIEGGESDILDVVAPFLAERGVPLHVSLHEPWWSRPVDPHWFDGFSAVRGVWNGFEPILAIP